MRIAQISRVIGAGTCAFALRSTPVFADECKNAVLNPCMNSDALWVHPGASEFVAIRSTLASPKGQVGFGLVTTLQSRPVVLRVFSPGPPGTAQAVVDNQLTAHFLWHYGVTDRLDLNAALPVTLSQNGAGLNPITAGANLPQVALRDARIGVGFALLRRPMRNTPPSNVGFQPPAQWIADGLGVGLRFDLSIPSGSADAFAGETGAVLAPAVVGDFRKGRFFAASEVALRLRKTSELLGARIGSQLFAGLGAGFDILTKFACSRALRRKPMSESLGVATRVNRTPLSQHRPNGRSRFEQGRSWAEI
jgi:hypothetical protein